LRAEGGWKGGKAHGKRASGNEQGRHEEILRLLLGR
jgi:hypothetical protein